MGYESKKNKIKQALLMGGLVLADRGSGKTHALAEILQDDPHSVVIVFVESQRRRLLELAKMTSNSPRVIYYTHRLDSPSARGMFHGKLCISTNQPWRSLKNFLTALSSEVGFELCPILSVLFLDQLFGAIKLQILQSIEVLWIKHNLGGYYERCTRQSPVSRSYC